MNVRKLVSRSARVLLALILLSSAGFLGAEQKKPAADPPAASEEGLGVQEHEVGGVDVILKEVKRTGGDTLTVRWGYRNNTNETKLLTERKWNHWPFAEAYVLDTVHKTKYEVVRDEKKVPVASKYNEKGVSVGSKQTLNTWAKFAAPPADVEKVTIVIPKVAPFENIPIAK